MTPKPSKSTPSTSEGSRPLISGYAWALALNLYELSTFGLCRWWWRLHWAAWKGYRALDISAAVSEFGGEDPGELAYGETPSLALQTILQWSEIRPPSAILDLGFGRGLALFSAALQGYRAAGIELVPQYVSRAGEVAGSLGLEVELRQGDLLIEEWPEADLVLINSTAFPAKFRNALLQRLEELAPGTRVATYDWQLPECRFRNTAEGRLPVSWGTVWARVFIVRS